MRELELAVLRTFSFKATPIGVTEDRLTGPTGELVSPDFVGVAA